ncbi:hypothetical protein [Acidianus bottle-shaped virus]|uniref:Uncharacterized protein ORF61c n=1 Tax=Acidianus bottle-shaped virus (isolate Italy/Pozzuoli) TaxID=654911 RepID=Y061C_ABVP|nr:hypothetical protein ABV_gp16 [Acidianus bottle-shaped virus]A4ZUA2.1 RecName: Full=Uncharacterized protein ORF61c [Acidianus bottle-shaped virus (isolate Pozzuoli)]ABP73406.1 hypothetical protein [Acidianus bottle-shaped virus]
MRKCISICFYEEENDNEDFEEEVELSREDLNQIINELAPFLIKLLTDLTELTQKKEESENE